jgi:hypothetical protein
VIRKEDQPSILKRWKRARRLKRDGNAVGLEVDGVAVSVASLAASSDVGSASLLDGDGDCERGR